MTATDDQTTDDQTTDDESTEGPGATTSTAWYASPIGPLLIETSADGVRTIWLPNAAEGYTGDVDPGSGASRDILERTVGQLDEYFAGTRTDFDVPLDPHGTEFQLAAWSALSTIPYGTTVTYAEQAEKIGDRRKARAIGAANGRNPIPIVVPCHRVIGADGSLTGFGGGLEAKAWLLAHERAALV